MLAVNPTLCKILGLLALDMRNIATSGPAGFDPADVAHERSRAGLSRRLLRGRDKEERISVEDASQRDGGACAGDSFGAPWARALPLTTVFTSSGPKRNPTNAEPGWGARVTWHAPSSRRPRLLSLNHRMNFQFQNAYPFGRMLGKSLRALRFNQMPALYRRRNVPAA
jgi:hypothetical protein